MDIMTIVRNRSAHDHTFFGEDNLRPDHERNPVAEEPEGASGGPDIFDAAVGRMNLDVGDSPIKV